MSDNAGVKKRIYLDNAATSWPKPPEVTTEITRYYTELGVAAGRGNSAAAVEVDRTIATCRSEIAKLVHCDSNHVAFCFNGTDALHLALNGLIDSGDEVVTTCVEHNSVLRPLHQLQDSSGIQLQIVSAKDGVVDLEHMAEAITATTKLVCVSHASNVTGQLQPIEPMARLCRQNNALLVVDAAQTVGHLPVDMTHLDCDVLVASGHKGLLGPLGTGFIALSNRAAAEIRPTRLGGTGTHSETLVQPDALPFRLESGNMNVGGIFGLLAGIQFINKTGLDVVSGHEQDLRKQIVDGLSGFESISIYANARSAGPCTGVVSFNIDNQDCHTVAALLDSAFGICVRAGLHCAPLVHASIGSLERGGTVRVSPGAFTTNQQINFFLEALETLTTQWV